MLNPYVTDIRVLTYLKNLLMYEKEQMEKAKVSKEFFEYQSVCNWLLEINCRIANFNTFKD